MAAGKRFYKPTSMSPRHICVDRADDQHAKCFGDGSVHVKNHHHDEVHGGERDMVIEHGGVSLVDRRFQ